MLAYQVYTRHACLALRMTTVLKVVILALGYALRWRTKD